MKKIYTLILASGVALSAMAQNRTEYIANPVQKKLKMEKSSNRSTKDTLVYQQLFDGTWNPAIYGVTGGGYILGNNTYGDKQKVQSFIVGDLHPGTAHKIEGAVIWFGGATFNSADSASKIKVNIYNLNGPGTNLSGPVNTAPNNTVLSSVDVLMSTINNDVNTLNDFTYITFTTPVIVGANQDYAIGIDVTTLNSADSCGIVSSTDGEYAIPEVVWEEWSPSGWYTLPAAGWGSGTFDVASAIMAAIDNNTASVQEITNIVSTNAYPNPAVNYTTISYSIDDVANVNVKVTDITGKLVAEFNEGIRQPGYGLIHLNTTDFPAGTYFFTVSTEKGSKTNKFVVTK